MGKLLAITIAYIIKTIHFNFKVLVLLEGLISMTFTYQPTIYNLTIFDDINFFPLWEPPRKIHHWAFASFSENAQGARSGIH